jgi:hypothetical protein
MYSAFRAPSRTLEEPMSGSNELVSLLRNMHDTHIKHGNALEKMRLSSPYESILKRPNAPVLTLSMMAKHEFEQAERLRSIISQMT